MTLRYAVLHGPNLDLLGAREPAVYGTRTLAQVDADLQALAAELGVEVDCFQSNHEGALIDQVHGWMGQRAGAVVNAGGLTHTSVSLRDALVGVGVPFVEVHLSNVYAREPFRHTSLLSAVALGTITGLGPLSYTLGLRAIVAATAPGAPGQ